MKSSYKFILKYGIALIIILGIVLLWFFNNTLNGIMLKNGLRKDNIIFDIKKDQWKIFLFQKNKNMRRNIGFFSVLKKNNKWGETIIYMSPILSEKTIISTGYSSLKSGIPETGVVIGGTVKANKDQDIRIVIKYSDSYKEIKKVDAEKRKDGYIYFIYDMGYQTQPSSSVSVVIVDKKENVLNSNRK